MAKKKKKNALIVKNAGVYPFAPYKLPPTWLGTFTG